MHYNRCYGQGNGVKLNFITLHHTQAMHLQPLDVACFKHINHYKDMWAKEKCSKGKFNTLDVFCSSKNIEFIKYYKSFKTIGIWPLNPNAMVGKM